MSINEKKYENLILYLCKYLGGSIHGKKKLAKLLYFVDFDRFEFNESMKSVSGDTYTAWKMGPVPKHYAEVIKKMLAERKLEHTVEHIGAGYKDQEIYTAKAVPDEQVFDSDDLRIMQRVVKKYGNLNGKELEILTHQEAPWVATDANNDIMYELALYRGTDFTDVVART